MDKPFQLLPLDGNSQVQFTRSLSDENMAYYKYGVGDVVKWSGRYCIVLKQTWAVESFEKEYTTVFAYRLLYSTSKLLVAESELISASTIND